MRTSRIVRAEIPRGSAYADRSLVFAKDWSQTYTRKGHLGEPLQANNIGERSFRRLINPPSEDQQLPRDDHTSATLLLLAGDATQVVAQRLGDPDISIICNTCSHILPIQQRDAAAKPAGLLHGSPDQVICQYREILLSFRPVGRISRRIGRARRARTSHAGELLVVSRHRQRFRAAISVGRQGASQLALPVLWACAD